ncbi:hypothetical protein ABWL39_15275 [Chitinivorax sp. PXF-14]
MRLAPTNDNTLLFIGFGVAAVALIIGPLAALRIKDGRKQPKPGEDQKKQ